MSQLILDERFRRAWEGSDPFKRVRMLEGKIYRELDGRRTLRFELGGEAFFLKIHQGVGWPEVIKNLLQIRLPIIGARNEWQAINRLHEIGIATMQAVAYGKRGFNPAKQLSFIITEELSNTESLEDIAGRWQTSPPSFAFKKALIDQVAHIAKNIHQHGINHRDFYLCHFLLDLEPRVGDDSLKLFLVDLHRAQLRHKTPFRWVVKDLGGLYFSAQNIGLTQRDVLRFMKAYSGQSLRQLQQDNAFWLKAKQRARKINIRYRGVEPDLPL